jgi:hypothetical protein
VHEYEGTTILQNVENYLSNDIVSLPRRLEFSDWMILEATGCGGKKKNLHRRQEWNLILYVLVTIPTVTCFMITLFVNDAVSLLTSC